MSRIKWRPGIDDNDRPGLSLPQFDLYVVDGSAQRHASNRRRIASYQRYRGHNGHRQFMAVKVERDDPLAPARGCAYAVLLSLAFIAVVVIVVFMIVWLGGQPL